MSLLNPNLKAFVAIVKTTTVHGAAKEIGLTQTGVTQRIRSLENELSVTLFVRSRRGMQLTSEGQALLRYCQIVQDVEGETRAQIQGDAKRGSVRLIIVGPTSVMSSRVVPNCVSVLEKFENLLMTFQVDDLDSRVNRLRAGTAHMAILSPRQIVKEIDSKLLKSEKYVLVGPSVWKGRRIQDVLKTERLIDFDETDDMTFSYLREFGLMDSLKNLDRIFVNNNEALIELFRRGLGFGVLTLEVAQPHIDRGEITVLNSGQVYENHLALAWYPRPQMPDYFKSLLQAIR